MEQNLSCRKLAYILVTFQRLSQGGILWKESLRATPRMFFFPLYTGVAPSVYVPITSFKLMTLCNIMVEEQTTWNIKILKKIKKYQEISSFYICMPLKSYDVQFLRYRARWTEFFVILDNFLPIYPLKTWKIKILKKWKKKVWRYYHFTQVYQKSWSYAILFLRYGAWQM